MNPPGYKLALLIRRFDHFGYLQQRLVCGEPDHAGEDVLYKKRMVAVDGPLVAAGVLYQPHEPDVRVIVRISGPLVGAVNVLEVVTGEGGSSPTSTAPSASFQRGELSVPLPQGS